MNKTPFLLITNWPKCKFKKKIDWLVICEKATCNAKQLIYCIHIHCGILSLNLDRMTSKTGYFLVLQIIKSNKSKTKLSIVFEGNKKREYSFEQSAQREAFCQLLQYLRNKHSTSREPDCVSIFCGTWNMGERVKVPMRHLKSVLKSSI